MLALASSRSGPWRPLPYIGSSVPPCGFCGLFVRALNIAVGIRIKTAPIHHSPRLLAWSFPEFPILPSGLDNDVDETQIVQLMHQDLQRVIKNEWDHTYFPFHVPWPQVKPQAVSYSDSDDDDSGSSDTG
ncbi:hypothetical protein DL93DRAFT_2089536 [Clavulina sp. PMI_390]|nr:hypothetical protein DL93DRAFT_2089536 [Clavulina sp. PMI_390]